MLDKYYSTDELVEILKITRQTIWNLSKDGRLVPVKIGRRNLYREADVKKLLGEK